jgi:flagellar operon protein
MPHRIDAAGAAGVRPLSELERTQTPAGKEADNRADFGELLKAADARQVQFSKHATQRLEQRQITLTDEDLALLSDGITRAEQKGSKESLLLMDKTAFVVNVSKRTVITAVDEEGMKGKAFTNIDSAILLARTSK